MSPEVFSNPFRPGAGHAPPYLAGRDAERLEFARLLSQEVILENLVLTGLRGVGKTVLVDTFQPLALQSNWMWVGTDISESATVSEAKLALRLLTDLSLATSGIVMTSREVQSIGFKPAKRREELRLDFDTLSRIYELTPGLTTDKLKQVLEMIWKHLAASPKAPKGLIIAYDEAQNLADHAGENEFPLSGLLDVFQSIQKKGIPIMLVLTGLPTLFPKLVVARTFSERMFRVLFLDRLNRPESRDAILKPLKGSNRPRLDDSSVDRIIQLSAGYPYFIQFICREVYGALLQGVEPTAGVPIPEKEILRKLDSDFFAGRWARATDRQRDLLFLVSELEHCEKEFTVQEIVNQSKRNGAKPFSASQANQLLAKLSDAGLVYKNRHGKYSFAVPLLGEFIRRQRVSSLSI